MHVILIWSHGSLVFSEQKSRDITIRNHVFRCMFRVTEHDHHLSGPRLSPFLSAPESRVRLRGQKNKTPLATDLEKRRNGCRETWHLVKSFKRSLKCGRFSHYISHYSTTSWTHWQLRGRCPTMRFKLIHWKIFGKDILERYACLFLHA